MSQLLTNFIKINERLNKLNAVIQSNNKFLGFKSNTDSFVKEIDVCRSDVKIIESVDKWVIHKCFWPKCRFKTNFKHSIENHQLIHENRNPFNCLNCGKYFRNLTLLKKHQ